MKGNEKVIQTLNDLLAEELTAINQYFVHAEMCDDWEYGRLHAKIKQRAIDEMKHAEKLIERIIFLENQPNVSRLNKIVIGSKVDNQFRNDVESEKTAIESYNKAIEVATECGDNGTRQLLEAILNDEEDHLDWLEGQLDQIEQIGLEGYLSEQIKE